MHSLHGKIVITGVAGFIGSSIAQRLLDQGHTVVGVDCLTDYYPLPIKQANLASLHSFQTFSFIEQPILEADWPSILKDCTVVFHQAAQAGVRASWGSSFADYTTWNVLSTQHLLESIKTETLKGQSIRLVNASSSSVYGETNILPMKEEHRPQPLSPYGVTKLAAEHLCVLYWKNFQIPTISLRYFTVYGPKQRPDMAFHKFIKAGRLGRPITVYGNGEQTRDYTFVDDIVDANIAAATINNPGGVYNLGGGTWISTNEVLNKLSDIMGCSLAIERIDRQYGDVSHTFADVSRAQMDLGFHPKVSLDAGLRAEVEWFDHHHNLLCK